MFKSYPEWSPNKTFFCNFSFQGQLPGQDDISSSPNIKLPNHTVIQGDTASIHPEQWQWRQHSQDADAEAGPKLCREKGYCGTGISRR